MPQPSPYTPGEVAKQVPGRATQLAFYTERAQLISQLGQFIGRVRVDYAARGVGKTSLLREAQRIFDRHEITTIWVTANEDEVLARTVLGELRKSLPQGRRTLDTVKESIDNATMTIGWGPLKGTVTVKPGAVATASASKALLGVLRDVTASIVEAGGAGLVILVDEVQSADQPSLRALALAWQEMASVPVPAPAGLFAAGLPGSQDHITGAVTFSERFDFTELFGIDDGGAAMALSEPASDLGVAWEADALRHAVRLAEGYPYKVQLIGDASWVAADRPDAGGRISLDHVDAGLPEVDRSMQSLFATRWRNASRKQRQLLLAVAELGGTDVKREDIAARLGVSTQAISMARDGLLRKGIVDANRHGRLSFTVPGFTEYILEQG